jgi:DNA-binding transcriptional MerR regulator
MPKPRRTFALATEVAEAAGVSFVTLRSWVSRGILPPPIESLRGRGNVAKYPLSAVPRADLARRLRDDGWSLDAIAEHIKSQTWADEAKASSTAKS